MSLLQETSDFIIMKPTIIILISSYLSFSQYLEQLQKKYFFPLEIKSFCSLLVYNICISLLLLLPLSQKGR